MDEQNVKFIEIMELLSFIMHMQFSVELIFKTWCEWLHLCKYFDYIQVTDILNLQVPLVRGVKHIDMVYLQLHYIFTVTVVYRSQIFTNFVNYF